MQMMRKWFILKLEIFVLLFLGVRSNRPKGRHVQLTEQLLNDYGPTSCRPVYDFATTVEVQIQLVVSHIVEFVSTRQKLRANFDGSTLI